jgi:hypothetical protein
MFLPRISQPDCAHAWLTASQAVHGLPGHEGHHVVLDVADPIVESAQARAMTAEVDGYLEAHTATGFPVRTVANTIFPQATYDDYGSPEFYGVYIDRVFPRPPEEQPESPLLAHSRRAGPPPSGPLSEVLRPLTYMPRGRCQQSAANRLTSPLVRNS